MNGSNNASVNFINFNTPMIHGLHVVCNNLQKTFEKAKDKRNEMVWLPLTDTMNWEKC
jgi:hypothetical protein